MQWTSSPLSTLRKRTGLYTTVLRDDGMLLLGVKSPMDELLSREVLAHAGQLWAWSTSVYIRTLVEGGSVSPARSLGLSTVPVTGTAATGSIFMVLKMKLGAPLCGYAFYSKGLLPSSNVCKTQVWSLS